jgi:hypothetical protein
MVWDELSANSLSLIERPKAVLQQSVQAHCISEGSLNTGRTVDTSKPKRFKSIASNKVVESLGEERRRQRRGWDDDGKSV